MGYHNKNKKADLQKKYIYYCNGGKGIPTRIKKSLGNNQPLGYTELFTKYNSTNK